MVASLKRIVPSLVLDALIVVGVAFPGASTYLRWPLLALYALLSWALFRRLTRSGWILTIIRDRRTRIAHGLEHATIAVLQKAGVSVVHGFTHERDRFVVALAAGQELRLLAVHEAAADSIRRIRDGERSLAYHPDCGTTAVVVAVTFWLVYVSSLLFSFVIGGSVALFFAVSLIVFRLGIAWAIPLGLLAQRLFTVSTDFTSASVVDSREVARIGRFRRPKDETWFEVIVDIRLRASDGGFVAPGAFA